MKGFVFLSVCAFAEESGRHQVVNQHTKKCLDWGAVLIQAVECDASNPNQFFDAWPEGEARDLFANGPSKTLDAGGKLHVWQQAAAGQVADHQRFIVDWDIGTIRHVPSLDNCFSATCMEEVNGAVSLQDCDMNKLTQRWSQIQVSGEPQTEERVLELGAISDAEESQLNRMQSPQSPYGQSRDLRGGYRHYGHHTGGRSHFRSRYNDNVMTDVSDKNVQVTRSVSFAGDYNVVVGAQRQSFLEECSFLSASCGAACANVEPGSIVVSYTGEAESVERAVDASLAAGRLPLRSFDVGGAMGEVHPRLPTGAPVPEVIAPSPPAVATPAPAPVANPVATNVNAGAAPLPTPATPAAGQEIPTVIPPAPSPIFNIPKVNGDKNQWMEEDDGWAVWAERVVGLAMGGMCVGLVCIAVCSCVMMARPKQEARAAVPAKEEEKEDGEESDRQPMLPAQLVAARKAAASGTPTQQPAAAPVAAALAPVLSAPVKAEPVEAAPSQGLVLGFVLPDGTQQDVDFGSRQPPLGLNFAQDKEPPVIATAPPGSHADQLGIREGWTLQKISGEPVAGMKIDAIRNRIKEKLVHQETTGLILGFSLPDGSAKTIDFTGVTPPLGLMFAKQRPFSIIQVVAGGVGDQKGVENGWTVHYINGIHVGGESDPKETTEVLKEQMQKMQREMAPSTTATSAETPQKRLEEVNSPAPTNTPAASAPTNTPAPVNATPTSNPPSEVRLVD